VSERPKVQLSKSCVGESPPWVQIPPSPPGAMQEKTASGDRTREIGDSVLLPLEVDPQCRHHALPDCSSENQ